MNPLSPLARLNLDLRCDPGGYAFNPTLFRSAAGLQCIYRHVDADRTRSLRRCSLDDSMRAGEAQVWSDEASRLGGDVTWYADPRAFAFGERWFVTFNTGHSAYPNEVYLTEIDDVARPLAAPQRLMKTDGRRRIEKNWGFFHEDGRLYCVYSIAPFVVLEVDAHGSAWVVATHHWHAEGLERAFGPLRGGASPLRMGDDYLLVVQSHTREAAGLRYVGSALIFSAEPPFRPRRVASEPLFALDDDERALRSPAPLNPAVAECLYPSGAVLDPDGEALTIAYGINDFRSGLRRYAMADIRRSMAPTILVEGGGSRALRTFHWQPEILASRTSGQLAAGLFRHGNAGDALQRVIGGKLFGARALNTDDAGGRLLGIGSIAHRMRAGDIIWGAGFKPVPATITADEARTIRAYAVRGPLTRDYLAAQGVDVGGIALFLDPGLLLAELLPAEIAAIRRQAGPTAGVLYLPHYSDTERFETLYGAAGHRVGTMDAEILDLVRMIVEAELVVSSSLHGVVFAEALGVPALLHRPPAGEHMEKYADYYLGTNRARFPILEEGRNPGSVPPASLPVIPPAWRDSLPGADTLRDAGALLAIETLGPWGSVTDLAGLSGQGETVLDATMCRDERFGLRVTVEAADPVILTLLAGDRALASVSGVSGRSELPLTVEGAALHPDETLLRLRCAPSGANARVVRVRVTPPT